MDINYTNQMKKGMLVLVLLKLIGGSEVYVADILAKLQATEFATQEGTLYPLMARLRKEELITYRWVESESGPPRKYYMLTQSGKQRSKELETYLIGLTKTITKLGDKK
jgi:PadR family transcriptional regulator PadR